MQTSNHYEKLIDELRVRLAKAEAERDRYKLFVKGIAGEGNQSISGHKWLQYQAREMLSK